MDQNLEVTNTNSTEMRELEVVDKFHSTRQTNPIARKLLDFSRANKTRKFSVKDVFSR